MGLKSISIVLCSYSDIKRYKNMIFINWKVFLGNTQRILRCTLWYCFRNNDTLSHKEGVLNWVICCLIAQPCPTFCNPVDCGISGFSVHGILQARIWEWVAISSSRGASPPRFCIGRQILYCWAFRECSVQIMKLKNVVFFCAQVPYINLK